MTTTHRITFTEESLTFALNLVNGLHELSTDLIAGDVFRMSSTTVGHDSPTPAVGVTDSDVDRLVETVACLVTYAEDEAAATCDDEGNSEKAWDAADKARALLEEVARKRSEARPSTGSPAAAKWEHGLDQAEGVQPDLNILHVGAPCTATAVGRCQNEAEGCKPEIDILPSGSITAASTPMHGLDKAEGEQPDLNFQLLLLAERSFSLLEDWVQHTSVSDQDLNDQIKETRELLEAQSPTWSTAVRDLLAERRRQVRDEGHTLERDDGYIKGQLAQAASAYAFWADPRGARPEDHIEYLNSASVGLWPWAKESWKPTSQRLMLIKAGALILAELERLDRQVAQEVRHED